MERLPDEGQVVLLVAGGAHGTLQQPLRRDQLAAGAHVLARLHQRVPVLGLGVIERRHQLPQRLLHLT